MKIQIADKYIGVDEPVFIVAEMSANHGGDINKAKEIIKRAKDCGADAVKLQTYRADTITLDCEKQDFLIQKMILGTIKKLFLIYIRKLIRHGSGMKSYFRKLRKMKL